MTLPNPCCCGGTCIIFEDDFDGEDLSDYWDIIAGAMDVDGFGIATIDGGSTIGPATAAPSGSAGFSLQADWPDTSTLIKFCYADANNHWLVEITGGHTEPVSGQPAYLIEVNEVVAGTPTFKGSRYLFDSDDPLSLGACWGDGDAIEIDMNSTTDAVFRWPNNVTGGTSFRIEPTDDLEVTTALWVKSESDVPGEPNCCANPTCMLCDTEFNDTIQIEALDGPNTGETFILDRYLLHTSAGGGTFGSHQVGYWNYSYIAGSGASNYSANLNFCVSGMSADEGRVTISTNSLAAGSGTADFDASDCAGPWDVVIQTVTYRITLL